MYNANQELVGHIANGKTYFYLKNAQGDIQAVINEEGLCVKIYVYSAWGKEIDREDPDLSAYTNDSSGARLGSSISNYYRGYEMDNNLYCYYLQSRYYDPYSQFRFINADIPQIAQQNKNEHYGLNLFAYCVNNPVMYSDPSGEISVTALILIGAAVGAVIGGIGSYVYQKHTRQQVNPLVVGVDTVSGGISGALAFTGIGITASVILNIVISVGTYVIDSKILGESVSSTGIVISGIVGGINGLIGGVFGLKDSPKILTHNYNVATKALEKELFRANEAYAQKAAAYISKALLATEVQFYRTFLTVIVGAIISGLHPEERIKITV